MQGRRGVLTGREWATVAALAAALRCFVALVLLRRMPLVSDAQDYFDLATKFARGEWGGAFYWPPGQPMVLAAAFHALGADSPYLLLAARVVTIAISVAGVVFTVRMAGELAGAAAARMAAVLAIAYPPSVLLSGQTYAQHLAGACLAAAAYFGLRARREKRLSLFALTGLCLALGCLTRPSMASVGLVVAVAWCAALLRERREVARWATGLVVAGACAIGPLLPVLLHDVRAGAGWTLSTNNERNLFLGNNPFTPDYKTSHLGQRSLEELPPETRAYLSSFYARPDARRAMQREAVAYMTTHPLRTAWRSFNRATSFWGFDYLAAREIQNWRGWSTGRGLPLLAAEAGGYLLVMALALVALIAQRDRCDRGWRAWLVAMALAYEAPYALAFSGGTYHFPVMPLALPLAAVALVDVRETWIRLCRSRAALTALALFAVMQAEYAYYAIKMQ